MSVAELQEVIRRRLAESGRTAHRVAIEAGLPGDAIKRVLDGHEPRIARASKICQSLGLELCVREQTPSVAPHSVIERLAERVSAIERRLGISPGD